MAFFRSSSPFARVKRTTSQLMSMVLLALIPGILVQTYFFGAGVIAQLIVAILLAWAYEALALRLRKKPVVKGLHDHSALVTGILLAISIPPLSPWWILAIGLFFAIIVAKHLYGGLGDNLFNPAMVAYVVLLISFPVQMTSWVAPTGFSQNHITIWDAFHLMANGFDLDGLSLQQIRSTIDGTTMATPLDAFKTSMKTGQSWLEINQMPQFVQSSWVSGAEKPFMGIGWGWVNIAYLCGGLFLLQMRIIQWQIPVAMLSILALFGFGFFYLDPDFSASPILHLFSGATMLGAFFIATDPVTAATTPKGRLWYGALIGAIIYIIRTWGGFPDGLAFAVLLTNMMVPLIDYYTKPRVYGQE